MEVVILCGGKGTRLKEETEHVPKPMIKIGSMPILWHIMKIYSCYGFNNFVLPLGYKGEIIKNYFLNFKAINNNISINLNSESKTIKYLDEYSEEWNVTLIDTGLHSLKGLRVKQIQKYITKDLFMMTYGDGVADINIQKLLEFHIEHGKIGTMTGVHPPSELGMITTEGSLAKSFSEKPLTSGDTVNAGFFVFNYDVFNYLSPDKNYDLEINVLNELIVDKELMVYEHRGKWKSMDSIRDLEYLRNLWNNNKAFWKIWDNKK